MYSNAEIADLAGNAAFQTATQIASIIVANQVRDEATDGSPRARKRNALAQGIITDTRSQVNTFAWALALDSDVQNATTRDSDNVPSTPDAVLLVAALGAWDKIAGVVAGDEVIPEPFTPPTA